MSKVTLCLLDWCFGGLTTKVWPLTLIVEDSPVGGLFDSRVGNKFVSLHFRIYQLFFEALVEYVLPPRPRMNKGSPRLTPQELVDALLQVLAAPV